MNRIYRLIWNTRLNTWIVAAENARAQGNGGRTASRTLAMLCVTLPAFAAPPAPTQLPTGGQVVAGQANIQQSGARMDVNQLTQRSAINWSTFNIGAQAAIHFNQPSATSVTLNRVLDSNPSQIFGSLTANGQVFVVNPNGVLFGNSAQANVGGLVATTLSLGDADFMAGKYTFTNNGTVGQVLNQGKLTATQGGYIALLAPEVRNEGVILATLGTALLAAGDKITLNLNNGSALSYSIDHGTFNALVDNKQLIQADGGQVILSAKAADTLSSAIINNTGTIEARSLQSHNGKIQLLGDMQLGTVNVGGTLDASAPSPSASLLPLPLGEGLGVRGGFIETSAAHVKVAHNAHITTAANGLAGTWLIDPVDFTIAATGGDITGAQLAANLALNNVIIQSTTGLTGTTGNVNVNDVVSWAANKLTLNAQNNIHINANLNASGTASLALEYGQQALAAGNLSNYFLNNGAQVNLPAGQNFSTKLGSDGAVKTFTVINTLGAAGSATATDLQGINGNLAGNYVLGSNIDAAATSAWNAGAGFAPLGGSITAFTGTLDGLGHSIANLSINRPTTSGVGLFGYTNTGAYLANVGLIGNNILGAAHVGGLVGLNAAGTIYHSYATGNVTGTSGHVGSLVGINALGTVSYSYATGNVNGGAGNVGGLIGASEGRVSNSYAAVNVSGTTGNIGGLVGYAVFDTIDNCYATGNVSGTTGNVGGLVGRAAANTINNSYATGNVTGATLGGFIGSNGGGTITHSFWDTTTTSGQTIGIGGGAAQTGVIGLSTAQLQTLANLTTATTSNGNVNPLWDFANIWVLYEGNTRPLLRSFMTPLTITANNIAKIYDGLSGLATGITFSAPPNPNLLGSLNWGGARNAGSYAASGFYSSQQGYLIDYVGGGLTISPAPLTVSANAASKTFDGMAYTGGNGVNYAGFVNAETAAVLGGALSYGGSSQNAVNAGNYVITPRGLVGLNYTMTYIDGSLTVNPAAVTTQGIPPITPPVMPTPLIPAAPPQVNPFVILPADAAPPTTGSGTPTTQPNPSTAMPAGAPAQPMPTTSLPITTPPSTITPLTAAPIAPPVATPVSAAAPSVQPAADNMTAPVKPLSPIATLTNTLSGGDQPAQALDTLSGNRTQLAIASGMNPVLAARLGNTYSTILAQQLSKGVSIQAATLHAEQVFTAESSFPPPKSPQAAAARNLVADGQMTDTQQLAQAKTPAGTAAFDRALSAALAKGLSFDEAVKVAQAAVQQADVLAQADQSPQSQFANNNAAPFANRSATFQKTLSALLARGVPFAQAIQQATRLSDAAEQAVAADARSPAVSLASGNFDALAKYVVEPSAGKALSSALARGIPLAEALARIQKITAFEEQATRNEARNPNSHLANGRNVPPANDANFDRILANALLRGQSPAEAIALAQRATPAAVHTLNSALASGDQLALLPSGNSRVFRQILGRALAQGLSPQQALQRAQRAEDINAFHFTLPVQVTQKAAAQPIQVTLANGQPLPSWLKFNAQTHALVAAELPDGALPLSIMAVTGKHRFSIEISEGGVNNALLSRHTLASH